MYWPCYWICERLGITTKPRGGSRGRTNAVERRVTLSLLWKQTGRATRPLSPLKTNNAFQFVPTDENNHKVKILQMLIVFKFTSCSFCVPAVTDEMLAVSVSVNNWHIQITSLWPHFSGVSTFVKVTPLDIFKEMSGYVPASFVWTAPESEP